MLQSLIEDRVDDISEEEEPDEEVAPEANEASEEPKAVDNSKRASDLLEKIKNMKEVPEDES